MVSSAASSLVQPTGWCSLPGPHMGLLPMGMGDVEAFVRSSDSGVRTVCQGIV